MRSDDPRLLAASADLASSETVLSPLHAHVVSALRDGAEEVPDDPRPWHAVESPIMLSAERIGTEIAAITRLSRLIAAIPDLAFDGDRSEYFRFLGLPKAVWPLLLDDGMPTDFFARPDCVLSGGRLQVLEFNIGTGTVNMTAAFASKLHLELGTAFPRVADELGQDWEFLEWSADAELARVIRDLGQGRPVGLWYHGDSAARRRAADMCEVLETYDAAAVPVHTGRIRDTDMPVFGYHSSVHLLGSDGHELAAALGALGGRDRRYLRPGDLARTAKTNLALLHDLADAGRLSDRDAELVRRHIPETRSVRRLPAEARERKDGWVLKPGVSFKAQGVVLGRELSEAHWSDALEATPDGVVQRLVEPDPLPLTFHHAGRADVVEHGALVLMPHIIAGRSAGLSARYSPDKSVLGRIDFESVHSTLCVLARRRD